MSTLVTAPSVREESFEGFTGVRLSAGGLEAVFVPGLGMVAASLLHAGEELLDRRHGLEAYREQGTPVGIPLLHPWANRLAGDEYVFHGRRVRLHAVLRDENGLPIHGLVAGHPGWKVVAAGGRAGFARLRALLEFSADAHLHAAFPFRHRLVLEAVLTPDTLSVTSTLQATGGAPVPVAFGFHPFLRLPGVGRDRWLLGMPRRRRLELDARGLPTGRATLRPASRLLLGDRAFDDAYDRLPAGAAFTVAGAGRRISVVHRTGYPVAQVYSPRGAPFVCFEPMTAPVNALRSGAGLRRVMPGRAYAASFSIRVESPCSG